MTDATAPLLVIRADAGLRIGTGHAMRGVALAEAWREAGGAALFALAEATDGVLARLARAGLPAQTVEAEAGSADDARRTLALARERAASWIAVDGYHFGADYQRALHGRGAALLWIDDYGHAERYCADLVLNQNLAASEAPYAERAPHTTLLLGPRFALLRGEFRRARRAERATPDRARRLLVTLGGSDPNDVTGWVLDALALSGAAGGLEIRAVVGGSNPHRAALERRVAASGGRIALEFDSDAMPERMAEADLVIAAGGTTAWEILAMGLPSLVLVISDNQLAVARSLAEAGAAASLGRPEALAPEELAAAVAELAASRERRAAMSRAGRALVDGRGAERVVAAMRGDRTRVAAGGGIAEPPVAPRARGGNAR